MPLGGITLNLLGGDLLTSFFQEMLAENMQSGMYPTVLTEIEATELRSYGQSLEFNFEISLSLFSIKATLQRAPLTHSAVLTSKVPYRAALRLRGVLPPDRHPGEPDLLASDHGHLRYGLRRL